MTDRWTELNIEVARDDAEAWADACLEAGALSVLAEDADADTVDEVPSYGEPGMALPPVFGWQRTRLSVLVDAGRSDDVLMAAAAVLERALPTVLSRRGVADQDWVASTQSQFQPMDVGQRLRIVPSWSRRAAADARIELVVDPGLAFGTGSHPTTRMCLEWLDQAPLQNQSVIDYGCGSGILAIAAARLGARPVHALDIDPQAVSSSLSNARINGADLCVQLSTGAAPAPADVVVANILSSPLKLLAPLLGGLVRPGGWLVLAGVLERQFDEVAACYAPMLCMQPWRRQDGWVCMTGRRSA